MTAIVELVVTVYSCVFSQWLCILCMCVYVCFCTCMGKDKPHVRSFRHKGDNICIEGPPCPTLMEIQSSSLSPCFLVMPAAKPQMDHYVSAEWEVKRPPMEIGMGVGTH